MNRVVIDTNVWISAVIVRTSPPAAILRAVRNGRLTAIGCPRLVEELSDTLARKKFRRYLTVDEAVDYVTQVERLLDLHPDPAAEALVRDPDDDYLVALARQTEADALVTGDQDLLAARDDLPVKVVSPRELVDLQDR